MLRSPRERVSPKARLMWMATDLLRLVPVTVVLVLGGGPWRWFALPGWLWAGYAVLAAAYVVGMPLWRWRTHRWEVTETAVYTQTGWWARERRIAPMSRIQTVDHAEGAVERIFRLATVTVTTASAAGALQISGLDRDVARRLVDDLTLKADAVEGDAT